MRGGRGQGHRAATAPIRSNMTPMIDVVFLLIIFFMLVAEMSRARLVDLEPPRLREPASVEIDAERAVIVQVLPESMGGGYRLGDRVFGGDAASQEALSAAVRERVLAAGDVPVLVRASHAEPYERVAPAIRAAGRAGVTRVQLVALPERGS